MATNFTQNLYSEVWITELMKQPIPDTSFVSAGRNLDSFVDNGIVKLIEAGAIPESHINFPFTAEQGLPIQTIDDIPHEFMLDIISTSATQHEKLKEIELVYDKKSSIVQRHKLSLSLAMSAMAAYGWSPRENNAKNKVVVMADKDSIVDHLIDMKAWYDGQNLPGDRHVVFTATQLARLAKEDAKLYKEVGVNIGGNIFGFKVWSHSEVPFYNSESKKRIERGVIPGANEKQGSFFFIGSEVFRCFGQANLYEQTSATHQHDLLSFNVRSAANVLRVKDPKYLAAII